MQIILSYARADFNALASLVLANILYPEAKAFLIGNCTTKVREFIDIHKNKLNIYLEDEYKDESVSLVILAGVREPYRLGKFADLVTQPYIPVHIYDNHQATHQSIVGDFERIEGQGTTVTVLLKVLKERSLTLSSFEATLCLLALYEDTGSLTYANTTYEDIEMAALMVRWGGRLEAVASLGQYKLSPLQRNLIDELLANSQRQILAGYQCLFTFAQIQEHLDDLAVIVDKVVELETPEVIFCVINMENRSFIVARSLPETVDVYYILRELGGTGHSTSAFASVKYRPLDELIGELKSILLSRLPKELTAKDIMSSPVECVDLEEIGTVSQAALKLQQMGHSEVCVRSEGELVGMLSRNDIDKAMGHCLGAESVETYMTTDFVRVDTSTPLQEIRRLLLEKGVEKIPVLESDKLVGIVGQGDILRFLNTKQSSVTADFSNLVPIEFIRMDADTMTLLKRCGEIANEFGLKVYAVGGFVRDLLLHLNSKDIDLVVEGDGIDYAQHLADRLGGTWRAHESFATAQVALNSGIKLDVVTARTETYTRPAALPDVQGSTLKQDLFRRDFSINAMALRLNPEKFGELIDFFGSRTDLEKGVVRILHNLSFVDDPTRIFRAVKFEQRYGFRMDSNTQHLLQSAVNMGLIKMVSFERLGNELWHILQEAYPKNSLMRLYELQILTTLDERLELDERSVRYLENLENLLNDYADLVKSGELNKTVAYLNTFLCGILAGEEAKKFVYRYAIYPTCLSKMYLESAENKDKLLCKLQKADIKNSEIAKLLKKMPLEALLYLASVSEDNNVCANINKYIRLLRGVEPHMNGKDLIALGYKPSPRFNEILKWLLDERLDGHIKDRTSAEAVLKERYPLY